MNTFWFLGGVGWRVETYLRKIKLVKEAGNNFKTTTAQTCFKHISTKIGSFKYRFSSLWTEDKLLKIGGKDFH